jgi:hypothetical protein
MIHRVVIACAAVLLAAACAGRIAGRSAEPVAFEIRGVVVNARTGAPEPAVLVHLAAAGLFGGTDGSGAFRIRGTLPPGRYLLEPRRVGLAPAPRRVRILPTGGAVDAGTLMVRDALIQLDDLVVPECLRHDRPPSDTAGAQVRVQRDSAGTFWLVCRPSG